MVIRSTSDKLLDFVNYILLAIVVFLTAFPFIHLLAIALNEGTDTTRGGIHFIPRKFTLVNFDMILSDALILQAYRITILRTLLGTFLGVAVTGLVAYGLSERKLPLRFPIMIYFIIPMFVSGGLIPTFLNLRELGLTNTFWVYVIPGVFGIWNCIVMKTFFQEIPEELKESMRMDGAGELHIFFKMIIPISMPLFAAISLFVAVGHWNDWFVGAFYVFKMDLIPVQTYLHFMMSKDLSGLVNQNGQDQFSTAPGSLLNYATITTLSIKVATVIITVLPIMCVYPFLQKYFVKGVMIGSIKG